MPTSAPLLLDLAGVARLAGVRRPVASMWRSRFAHADDPFPPPVTQRDGRPLFDATDVANWLTRTEHGNNPDAVADAAASAAPDSFEYSDPRHVAQLDALLTLRAASGSTLAATQPHHLGELARHTDPDDECLAREIDEYTRSGLDWLDWADRLTDAAYSPSAAADLIDRRHRATRTAAGSLSDVTTEGRDLLTSVAAALHPTVDAEVVLGEGVTAQTALALIRRLGDEVDLVVPCSDGGRSIRRRLLCHAMPAPLDTPTGNTATLWVARAPHDGADSVTAVLRELDELAIQLDDDDRALFLAPARILTDALATMDAAARADTLRSGRVRAIVRLPTGLVMGAPREALALWVLGREVGHVSPADRFTAIADLTDRPITTATRGDLASDIVAAMGSARDVRAHAFRFTRLVRTTSLLATSGALVGSEAVRTRTDAPARELPARIDAAAQALGDDAPPTAPRPVAGARPIPPASLESLIADGHVRIIAGTRVESDALGDSGLEVVTATSLGDPERIGEHRIDPLVLADRYPASRLTQPGDIVFRTAPSPRAWVDVDGSKVVAYPARVLRIRAADPGGLVPEVVAADIARATGGAGAWRRWHLRRVHPEEIGPLRAILIEIATRRHELTRRIDAFDTYSDLVTAGIASGTVTLTDHAAPAASDSL